MEICSLPAFFLIAIFSRFLDKKIDVGLGPIPLINNIYHKIAIEKAGFRAQTFVDHVYFITDRFDVRLDHYRIARFSLIWAALRPLIVFCHSVCRYRVLLYYFKGGALGTGTLFLWRLEPLLLKIAGVKTILLPYGTDVQELTRSPNLQFKNAMAVDYPGQKSRRNQIAVMIDLWTRHGDYVVSGCEWVDYMYFWDKLTVAHFSIDLSEFRDSRGQGADEPVRRFSQARPLRLLHAPNHKAIKGSEHFIRAISELRDEGYPVELDLIQRVSNDDVKKRILKADIVLDQLIIGWYAMFAIEAMASRKPVVCYLRQDLIDLYISADLITSEEEIPLINANDRTIKETLRAILESPDQLNGLGEKGYRYVEKFHSVEALSRVFREALEKILPQKDVAPKR